MLTSMWGENSTGAFGPPCFNSWTKEFAAQIGDDIQLGNVPRVRVMTYPQISNESNLPKIGWDGDRRHMLGMRCNGDLAATPKTVYQGSPTSVLQTGVQLNLNVTNAQNWLQNLGNSGQGGGTLGWMNGVRTLSHKSAGGVACWAMTVRGTEAQFDSAVTLGPDPTNANAVWVTNQTGAENCRTCGNFGWVHQLTGTPPVYPHMGTRWIYITKDFQAWYDVNLIGLDALASARIANGTFSLAMSEDGDWLGKTKENNANSRDILASDPNPQRRIELTLFRGLPRYDRYQAPYSTGA